MGAHQPSLAILKATTTNYKMFKDKNVLLTNQGIDNIEKIREISNFILNKHCEKFLNNSNSSLKGASSPILIERKITGLYY